MRTLGLDVGSRTIGVAVTDELGLAAHPVGTLARRGTHKDVEQVRTVARKFATEHLVVGIPLELDDAEGNRAKRVRVFEAALRDAGFRVEEMDERLSTVEAEEQLIAADFSRKKRKKVIDTAAAVVILERWMHSSRTLSR